MKPAPDPQATHPFGSLLTSLKGLRFVHQKPGERLEWAYVTNDLGEQMWIYCNDNLYLTRAQVRE